MAYSVRNTLYVTQYMRSRGFLVDQGLQAPGHGLRELAWSLRVGGTVEQIAQDAQYHERHEHEDRDWSSDDHQNAPPMKGSIRPKYITPIQSSTADAAMALTVPGTASPAPTRKGPSALVR